MVCMYEQNSIRRIGTGVLRKARVKLKNKLLFRRSIRTICKGILMREDKVAKRFTFKYDMC